MFDLGLFTDWEIGETYINTPGTVSRVPILVDPERITLDKYTFFLKGKQVIGYQQAGKDRVDTSTWGVSVPSTIAPYLITGVPASLSIAAGNNQAGPAGSVLPLALSVLVANSMGIAVGGAPVTFAVASGGGTFGTTLARSNAQGIATTTFTLGSVPGKILISASVSGLAPVQFTATANDVPSKLELQSGDNQTGLVGTRLPEALTVQVLGRAGTGLPGIQVRFSVSSGTVNSLLAASVTDAQGVASVGVTLGQSPGPVSIAATVPGVPAATFHLTAIPDPTPASYTIDTLAGRDHPLGDGGPATDAMLLAPSALAFDGSGNLWIADAGNARIRTIAPSGAISTIAGSGERGFGGDGLPASSAQLSSPGGLAFDTHGKLYLTDQNRIRVISSDGTISTLAIGAIGATNALVFDKAGNLYVADTFSHRVRRIDPSGGMSTFAGTGQPGFSGDGGDAAAARINLPIALVFDASGNLLIAEGSRVRRVSPEGVITTLLGEGNSETPAIIKPAALAVDASGTILVADSIGNRVWAVSSSGGQRAFAGSGERGSTGDGGGALDARLDGPSALVIDARGNLLIAEGNRVRMVDSVGVIRTVAGRSHFGGDDGPAASAILLSPLGVAQDGAGNTYVADSGNHRVRMIDSSGTTATIAGDVVPGFAGDGEPSTLARLSSPSDVALDQAGNIYIADSGNNRVRVIDRTGTIRTLAGDGFPRFAGDGGLAISASLSSPTAVGVKGDGTVYISDSKNHRVRAVATDGTIRTVAGDGRSTLQGDGGPAILASFDSPRGLALDDSGNLFIADSGNGRVRKVDPLENVSSVVGFGVTPGTARTLVPYAMAVDKTGNLYIADFAGNRLLRLNVRGVVSTIAGDTTGAAGFSGDGDAATAARMNAPAGVAINSDGSILVVDKGNNRIRVLTPVR
ncbi:MAG: SMP-30/gluconolactonase/LRE family protein [Acidobacteria bacterium]|nr:SMP-30/gluconolactonase/LRE family protein [Acidobacteriota bacterium]